MNYNTIVNNPIERRKLFIHHAYCIGAFSENELDQIENICDTYKIDPAIAENDIFRKDCEKIRKSSISFIHKDSNTHWIFDRFNKVITNINNEFYGFDLNGYDSFQYTIYNSENQDKYDWHMDTMLGPHLDENFNYTDDMRKLTCVMLLKEPLKDFSGGEFQLNLTNQEIPTTLEMTRGKIIAFPSFLIHRVKPVYLGVRKSIVIWVEGPKFR